MICRNCKTEFNEEYKFCPMCGQQRRSEDYFTFRHFFTSFLGDYFAFDGKIFRSLRPLVFKPGFLTNEYIIGRRERYIPPVRLYIFISICFFLIFDFSSDALAEAETAVDQLEMVLNRLDTPSYWSKLFFLLMPIFALIMYLLYRKQHRYYAELFIFSLHFHAFVFLAFLFYFIISGFILPSSQWNAILLAAFLAITGIYLWAAMKRFQQQGWLVTTAKFLLVMMLYTITAAITTVLVAFIIYEIS